MINQNFVISHLNRHSNRCANWKSTKFWTISSWDTRKEKKKKSFDAHPDTDFSSPSSSLPGMKLLLSKIASHIYLSFFYALLAWYAVPFYSAERPIDWMPQVYWRIVYLTDILSFVRIKINSIYFCFRLFLYLVKFIYISFVNISPLLLRILL